LRKEGNEESTQNFVRIPSVQGTVWEIQACKEEDSERHEINMVLG